MIKINLLPQQKRTKDVSVEKDILVFLLGLLLLGAAVYGVDFYFNSKIADLTAAVNEKTKIKASLEEKVARVNAVLAEIKEIETRIKVIKDVRLRQGLPVRYIDELVVNIPQNKMWIETFTLGGSGQISLSGVALDNQAFATYVEKLRTSRYIASVDTQRTSRRMIDGLGLVSFQCTVKAKEYFENLDVNGTIHG